MNKLRVLYRHFLFRLMDVELLSNSAYGDTSSLLGQIGALLVFGSLLLAIAGATVGQAVHNRATPEMVFGVERFLVTLNMVVIGVFALLNWDATFLSRRDLLVLGPLPVPMRTLLGAKIAATASAFALVLAAWNCLSMWIWPLMLSRDGTVVATYASYWLALLTSGTFSYCFVLWIQSIAARLRASTTAQLALFVTLLLALCVPPGRDAAWFPPNWFVDNVGRGLTACAVAIGIVVLAFVAWRFREEPPIQPSARGGIWLPPFRRQPQTALSHFIIRTLLRSRRHRTLWSFYLGGGFAICAVYLSGTQFSWMDLARRENVYVLGATVLMLAASWLGARTVFAQPIDLRANWLFRVVPVPAGPKALAAVRRALLILTVVPVCAATALLMVAWPWPRVAAHLLWLALVGSALADVSLRGFRKIPFTCSYFPGKSKVHLVFWFGVVPVVIAIHHLVSWSHDEPVIALAVATLAAVAARWVASLSAGGVEPEIEFEETAPDELVRLRLL